MSGWRTWAAFACSGLLGLGAGSFVGAPQRSEVPRLYVEAPTCLDAVTVRAAVRSELASLEASVRSLAAAPGAASACSERAAAEATAAAAADGAPPGPTPAELERHARARALVDRAMADRTWYARDRDELAALLPILPDGTRRELLAQLFGAYNAGQLRLLDLETPL